MPTFVRREDGDVVETVVTVIGSPNDRRMADLANDDGTPWERQLRSPNVRPADPDTASPLGVPPRRDRL